MKIGDKVRFLSEIGGGKVAGFQSKNIVLVEDEDGFQIPMPLNDVVVVNNENYDTQNMVEQKKKAHVADEEEDYDPADRPVSFKAPVEERRGGDRLSAYLAFVPVDPRQISTTSFEAYIVNDSNYYLRFTLLTAEGNGWQLRQTAEVEPNTKLFVEEFDRTKLNGWERVDIQMIAYKRNKPFLLKPTVDVQLRVDTVKFYKLHTFVENDFFEQDALVYPVIENDEPARTLVIDARKLKQEMVQKKAFDASPARKPSAANTTKADKNAPVVVDLHASELLETTAGMSHSDILNYQLETMRKTIREYEKKKGTKIVFIHGKGEGVLRQAIINELRYRYKQYPYQDASFQEYGYCATQITIK